MTSYATVEQLTEFLEGSPLGVPSDAERLLDRASELIADHILSAVYDVDDDGAATAEVVIDVLAKATCAQAEFWLAGDEEDDILGPVQGVSTNATQLQYGAGDSRVTPMYLAPRAARHLRRGGLLSGVVSS